VVYIKMVPGSIATDTHTPTSVTGDITGINYSHDPAIPSLHAGPSVAEWLGRWTCDQQVAGLNPGLPAVEYNPW